ncbi:GGDEF domain-containing protein [Rhodoligotrophos ferricapiens]|uniref:GGDEF domain-containing protein n=1 Tax=Rhodoligotrophos ferricapiens TaxID=3069264 RepID=UPI00315D8CCC
MATVRVIGPSEELARGGFWHATLLSLSLVLFCEGVLRRKGRSLGARLCLGGLLCIAALAGIAAVTEMRPTLAIQALYAANCVLVLHAVWRLLDQRQASASDRLIFWALLALALQLLAHIVFPISFGPVVSLFENARLAFTADLAQAVTGIIVSAMVLIATTTEIIHDLRNDRDTDPLTQVLNRRGFEERGGDLIARKSNLPAAMIACDIDHFKRINDTYGHSAGDAVLRSITATLLEQTKPSDLIGRVGGEEFAILLPGTSGDDAALLAEAIRKRIECRTFPALAPRTRITASFGVAEYRPGDTVWDMFTRADSLLYEAKAAGRNRIQVETSDHAPSGIRRETTHAPANSARMGA